MGKGDDVTFVDDVLEGDGFELSEYELDVDLADVDGGSDNGFLFCWHNKYSRLHFFIDVKMDYLLKKY